MLLHEVSMDFRGCTISFFLFIHLCINSFIYSFTYFLEHLSKNVLGHYDTLPQFVSYPPILFVSLVHDQRGVSKAHALDT